MENTEALAEIVAAVNRDGGTYHRMDFGDGRVMDGDYDMTRYLKHYGIPEDLSGLTVLDVGTSSGFFAFECARRGGTVTAIDVLDGQVFKAIRDAVGLDISYERVDVLDLDAAFGMFDLVICGSLLLHLSDIFLAVRKLRSVCRGQTIVATACADEVPGDSRALFEFLGWRGEGAAGEYWTVWRPTAAGLAGLLGAAGFARAEVLARFTLSTEPGRAEFSSPHVVVKAFV